MNDSPTTFRAGDLEVDRRSLAKAYAASLAGTSLEWYDFAVYSAAAALVFPQLFFPNNDPLTGALLSFSTYAVGYVSRPIGGIVFGRLGDKIGRKKVLVITLVLIGVATFLIGLLPTYTSIGVAAPTILVLLRFAQGVGVGGEWGGAVLLSSEFGTPEKRGLWASAAQIGPPAGNLMANGMLFLLTAMLTEDQFLSWGWRVAFLMSAALVAFGLWIRLKLEDTPIFKALSEKEDRPTAPVKEVFTTELRPLISAIMSRLAPDILYALMTVFTITYGTTQLDLSKGQVLTAVLVASGFQLFLIPFAGALSDRYNRRLVYGIAAALASLWPVLFFLFIENGSPAALIACVVVGLGIHSFMYGPQAAFVIEQFSPRLRYTGSSLAYTIAGVFGGALAPLAFTWLLDVSGGWQAPAAYVAVAGVLTIIGLLLGRNPDFAEDEALLAEPTPAPSPAPV
ncbi:MFS transporter [Nocardioides sp. Root140]|uniref:MFS transporter n=1 Tax=Nocardioides sp. Root140 TaxID=1736460 RepID=UPI0006FE752B|nr:MFS transporter [Nocardioides sp. Root140]KQY56706.1 MFS transporter [Nocardioides sp. Root140]